MEEIEDGGGQDKEKRFNHGLHGEHGCRGIDEDEVTTGGRGEEKKFNRRWTQMDADDEEG